MLVISVIIIVGRIGVPNAHSVWCALKSIFSEVARLPAQLRKRNSRAPTRESRASGKEVPLEQADLRGSGFLTLIAYLSYVTGDAVLAAVRWAVHQGSCQALMELTCAKGWIQTYCVIFLPLFIAVDLEIHRAYWQVSLPAHESNGVYSSRYRNHHSYSC